MRLRDRLLRLFALFAVVPLLAIAGFGYVRSVRMLEALVESRTAVQAGRMARVFRDRLDHLESDIALVSGNEEMRRLLVALAAGDTAGARGLVPAHDAYIGQLWTLMQYGYERLLVRDATGRPVIELGEEVEPEPVPPVPRPLPPIVRQIRTDDGRVLGELEVWIRLGELLRGVGLDEGFGDRGWNLLVDRESQRTLAAGSGRSRDAGSNPLASLGPAALEGPAGSIRYEEAGERRVASFVGFDGPPWTIVATASVDEFATPFLRQRLLDLVLLVGVIAGVSIGFFLLLRRATVSLDRLAVAADRVGQGDLSPELPPEGPDEMGQLSHAFRVMAGRIREMLAQVEAGRQTAVLGRFAVELAHEIRNPLTSVKLNLQALERDGRDGRIPAESREAVAMALREIRRIDQALRTALRTGRPAVDLRPCSVHAVVEEAIALLRPEAAAGGVAIELTPRAPCDRVRGDPDALRAVFVNILLNGMQATADRRGGAGGTIRVATGPGTLDGDTPAIELRIRDEGPGIPPDLRDRVFHPFFTTREGGTGLGLSVALQTVRALGGTLRLGDDAGPGTEMIVTLPLDAHADAP